MEGTHPQWEELKKCTYLAKHCHNEYFLDYYFIIHLFWSLCSGLTFMFRIDQCFHFFFEAFESVFGFDGVSEI